MKKTPLGKNPDNKITSSLLEFKNTLERDNQKTLSRIDRLSLEISESEAWLSKIKSSRFYRIWQTYNKFKRIFINIPSEK